MFSCMMAAGKVERARKSSVCRPDEPAIMKHNHNHDNVRSAGVHLIPVRFEYAQPMAVAVCVAETFIHWQLEAKTLHFAGGDDWWKEFDFEHSRFAGGGASR
jgi:hypothetical protein